MFPTLMQSVKQVEEWRDIGYWRQRHLLWSWLWSRTSGRCEAKWCNGLWAFDGAESGSTESSSFLLPWELQSSSPHSGHLRAEETKHVFIVFYLPSILFNGSAWLKNTFKWFGGWKTKTNMKFPSVRMSKCTHRWALRCPTPRNWSACLADWILQLWAE